MAAGGNNIVYPTAAATGSFWLTTWRTDGGGRMLSYDGGGPGTMVGNIPLMNLQKGPTDAIIGHIQTSVGIQNDAMTIETETLVTNNRPYMIIGLPRLTQEGRKRSKLTQINEVYIRLNALLTTEPTGTLGINGILNEDDGTEKLSNGTFTGSATGWTLEAGWTYGANAVSHSGASDTVSQTDLDVLPGRIYKLVYTISAITGTSGIYPTLGGVNGTTRTTAGIYTEYIRCGSTDRKLAFTAGASFSVTLDTVSLKSGAGETQKTGIYTSQLLFYRDIGDAFDVTFYEATASMTALEELEIQFFDPSKD